MARLTSRQTALTETTGQSPPTIILSLTRRTTPRTISSMRTELSDASEKLKEVPKRSLFVCPRGR
ncbi:hypothetical protein QC764_0011420 [Podospora pseudoanserina]|uniref:Uncharacterized protein n=1 Tax=Podospora pseudoanserina TaxID=2609844 RepID=A0ABR0INE9_9PEZI|nr:hypothetical protein QC764_0011420 [Podospora pseudoanserina]